MLRACAALAERPTRDSDRETKKKLFPPSILLGYQVARAALQQTRGDPNQAHALITSNMVTVDHGAFQTWAHLGTPFGRRPTGLINNPNGSMLSHRVCRYGRAELQELRLHWAR